jgi:replicative DNA helicase
MRPVVPLEKLQALAAEAPKPKPPDPAAPPGGNGTYDHRLKVDGWLKDAGVKFKVKPTPDAYGRTVYVLEECPFDATHGATKEVAIFQAKDGKLGAACKHNSCQGRGWQEFKAKLGNPKGHHYDPPMPKLKGPRIKVGGRWYGGEEEDRPEDGPQFQFITSAEFARATYKREWLIRRVLVRGQPGILGGPKKALKTSIIVDAALSMGTGTAFLGEFVVPRPVRVALLSGESGEATLQETALRVAAAKGIDLEAADVLWGFELPQLSNAIHLAALRDALKGAAVEVLFLDPLYLSLLAGGGESGPQASNVYQMGPLLLGVARACLDVGCTPILAHHFRLQRSDHYAEPQLEDLAYSGVQEFARQWVLLGRRSKYEPGTGQHRLWLSVGGSAGHSGLWALNIDEGVTDENFSCRQWQVSVSPAGVAREEDRQACVGRQRAELDRQNRDDETAVLLALDRLDPDGSGTGTRKVVNASGIPRARAERAVERLEEDGILKKVPYTTTIGSGAKRDVDGICRAQE